MILKKGSTDPDVRLLQSNLNFLGFPCGITDGAFGPKTDAAVRTYQSIRHLSVDGKVKVNPGGETWTHLTAEVRWVQSKLHDLDFYRGKIDGLAGPQTRFAAIRFQREYGLVADGVAGSNTRGELENPVAPTPAPAQPIPSPPGITILPRSVWDARPPKMHIPQAGKAEEIIHHTESVIPAGADEFAEIRGIQNYHMDGRGWADIGYSALMLRDGRLVEGRGLHAVTAACLGHNTQGLNIAVLGSYQSHEPTVVQLQSLDRLTVWLKVQGIRSVNGHRDFNATTCPGDLLYARFAR